MRLFVLVSALTLAHPAAAQLSTNDGFNTDANNFVLDVDQMSDGRLAVAGLFTNVAGHPRNRVAVLGPSGTVDAGLVPVLGGPEVIVNAVLAEPAAGGGGLYLAGQFTTANGVTASNLAFYLPNGTPTTFGPGPINGPVTALVRDQLNFIIAGEFTQINGQTRPSLARLLPNGVLDSSFNFGPNAVNGRIDEIAVDAEGRVYLCGEFTLAGGLPRARLARVLSNGALDPTIMDLNGYCSAVAVAGDGSVWIGGNFTTVNGQPRARLARIDASGNLAPPVPEPDGVAVQMIKALRNGDLLIGGDFQNLGGLPRQRLARLTRFGEVLPEFTTVVGDGLPFTAIEQQDRQIVIGGTFTTVNSVARTRLARLYPDGSLDRATGLQGVTNIEAFMLTPDHQTYFAGNFTAVNGLPKSRLARVRADGVFDSLYGLGIESTVRSLVPANIRGAFWLGGDFISINGLARSGLALTDDEGALDAFAPSSNTASARVALQQDGKILVATRCRSPELCPASYPILRRYLANGAPDPSFSAPLVNSTVTVSGICPLVNGEIVVTGDFDANGILGHPSMIKLTSTGVRINPWPAQTIPGSVRFAEGCLTNLDSFFVAHDPAPGVAALTHYSADGSAIGLFNTANVFAPSGESIPRIHDAVLREDGKLLVAGNFSAAGGGATRQHLALLQFDGALDTAFNAQVSGQSIQRMLLQDDSKLWLSGRFTQIAGSNRTDLVRLKLPGPSFASLSVDPESAALEFRRSGGVGPAFNHPPLLEISADGVNYAALGYMSAGGSWRYSGPLQGYGPRPTIRISTTITTLAGNTLPYRYVEQIRLTAAQGGNDVIFRNGFQP